LHVRRCDDVVSTCRENRIRVNPRQRISCFPVSSGFAAFFYPVLNEEYAIQIARDWNTKDELSGYEGHVLKFSVRSEFLNRYESHVVGSSTHSEYWIPADKLTELNHNIVGTIEIIGHFFREP
jgi:hypothetical protein